MKSAVRGLNLYRKIVFVSRHASSRFPRQGGHGHDALARIQVQVGVGNRAANLVGRVSRTVARQIGSHKTSFPVGRVTLRALRLSEEKAFAPLRVAGQLLGGGSTLQTS